MNGSPVSSSFGYYIGGQKGTIFATGFSVFFLGGTLASGTGWSMSNQASNPMTSRTLVRCAFPLILSVGLVMATSLSRARAQQNPSPATAAGAGQFHDSHFHLTNYIQEGTDIRKYVDIMGSRVGGRRCSASRCSRPGTTATPVTSHRRITCRPTRRSTTTRSPTPRSPWPTARSTRSSRRVWIP